MASPDETSPDETGPDERRPDETGADETGAGNVAGLVARAAARHPDRTALADGSQAVTWQELLRRVRALAATFGDLGAVRGDRIAVQLEPAPDLPVVAFAALWAGLVIVPVDPRIGATDLAATLERAGCRVLVTSSVAALSVPHPVPVIAATNVAADGAHSLGALMRVPPDQIGPAAGAGLPMLVDPESDVALTHAALLANLEQIARIPALLRSSDVLMSALPLLDEVGFGLGLALPARLGATIVPADPATADLDALPEHRVTAVFGTSPLFRRWAGRDRIDLARAFATVRLALCATPSLDPAAAERIGAATRVAVHQSYGIPGTAPMVTTTLLSRTRKPGSIGIPVPGTELWLRDPDGDPAADGDPGEIVARVPASGGSGSAHPGGADRSVTGDLAYRDADGDLFLVARRPDVITVQGFPVYPPEVEAVLARHAAVAEVAVVGTPAPAGEQVTAFVVRRPGAAVTAEELIAWSTRSLARFKRPARIAFVRQLPHTPSGRLRRGDLRDGVPRE